MADKKLQFTIAADNTPFMRAMAQISVALNKANAGFRAAGKAGAKGGAFDPKNLNAVGEELKNANSMFKSLGMSVNQYNRDSGFTNLKKSFKGTAEEAGKLQTAVSGILAPLMALTGIGGVGAMANMAAEWGGLANQIKETGFATGMSTGAIQKWMGVGKSFGIDNGAMASGMSGFAMNMRDVAYSQNPGLQAFLASHHIEGIRARYEAGGVSGLMKEIFDMIEGQNVGAASKMKMLQLSGLGFAAPMMAYGPEERQKRWDISDKYGYATPQEIALANDYERSLFGLDRALEALHRNMSDKIIPEFQPIIEGFSNWIAKSNSATVILNQLSIAVGVTMVGAFALLSKAIIMSPLGRFLIMLDAVINGAEYLGNMPWLQSAITPALSAWDRFHPKNFGTNKSMMESQSDWEVRNGIKMSGLASMGSPVASGLAPGISISGNAPPQTLGTIQVNVSAPPGTKVTSTPTAGLHMPTNINHSGFVVP